MAGARATLMLGAWPEPFGLVAVESMATGTPVVARRAGACTETVTHGETGFIVDDVDEAVLAVARISGLNRSDLAAEARRRFSVERMVDEYEAAYERVLVGAPGSRTTKRRGLHSIKTEPDERTTADEASQAMTRSAGESG